MMKIAIMQPYLFPYIGYWQLINVVDKFVLLDDVNYIKRGYINRNSILLNEKPYRFSIPIKQASQNKLIKDTKLIFEEKEKKKFLSTITNAYRKAPFFKIVMPLIEEIIFYREEDLTTYIHNSLNVITKYLDINTEIYYSSKIKKDESLHAQNRIIEICKKMGADIYINSCGGRELYNHNTFQKEGIKLYFLDTSIENIKYSQGQKAFQKNLSIIDVLMFSSVPAVKKFLGEYKLNE